MRILLAILLTAALHSGAYAIGAPPREDNAGSGSGNRFLTLFNRPDETAPTEEAVEDDARGFLLPAVVAPLSRDGRLTGFAYVQIHLQVARGRNALTMQDSAHYALDQLVRAAYRTSLSVADGSTLDAVRAVEVWTEVLQAYYGPGAVERIDIRNIDTRLFRR